MILNSQTANLIRSNAVRLAESINHKDDLSDLVTAGTYEQVFAAIECLLTNTHMFFDEELLTNLDEHTWQSFKSLLLIYTLNSVNKRFSKSATRNFSESTQQNQSGPQIL